MKILLIDVDSTIPNLALMKLSSYHKTIGDEVELLVLGISYYPDQRTKRMVGIDGFDKVYVSAIFKGSIDFVEFDMFSDVSKIVFGGTGIDIKSALPSEIEAAELDYSIYPDNDTGYGFISRGCNRKCYFCVVPQKEGRTRQVETDLEKIIGNFKKVKFMDNNFLQLPNHLEIIEWLAKRKIKCQFNQGLDVRLITAENSVALSKLNYIGEYIFAFDDWKYRRFIERQMLLLKWIRPWGAKFFVYVHPDMELYETVRRIEFLRERELLPYVMRDSSCWNSSNNDFYVDIAAYANQPSFFKKMDFHTFLTKRHVNDLSRIELSSSLYNSGLSDQVAAIDESDEIHNAQ
jgi:organic radical activating enzyme